MPTFQHKFFQPKEYWNEVDLEREAIQFEKEVREALDETHPLKKIPIGLHELVWHDGELEKQKKIMRSKHKSCRRLRTRESYSEYVAERKLYYKAIRKKRHLNWKEFVEGHENPERTARFNKILNRQNMNSMGIIADSNGKPYSSPEESLKGMVGEHFPGSVEPKEFIQPKDSAACNITSEAAEFITVEKVKEALDQFGSHKAGGVDGFKPIVLKNLGDNMLNRLTELYKANYLLGYTPTNWRESKVIFIPKPGKEDYSDARAFRPISLMPVVVKAMERVILWHMLDTNLKENPLNDNQHAFRKGHSTDTALTNMVEYLEDAIINQKFALGAFLDIKGAFDNASTESIINGLRRKHTDDRIIKWYKFCLENRRITANYNGVEVSKTPTRGTPQGGVMYGTYCLMEW